MPRHPRYRTLAFLPPLSFSFTIYYVFCFFHTSSAFNFSFICLHNHLHLSIPSIQHRIPSTPCVAQAPLAVIANALYPDLDESWAILYLLFNTYNFIYPGRNLWVDPVISIQAFFMYLVRFLLLSLCPARTTAIDDTTTPPSTPSVDLSRVNFEFSSTIRRRDNVYFVPCTNHLLLVTLWPRSIVSKLLIQLALLCAICGFGSWLDSNACGCPITLLGPCNS